MSSTPSRRDNRQKPQTQLIFGSSNGSSGSLPSNMFYDSYWVQRSSRNRESRPEKVLNVETLVEKTRSLLKAAGPLEEKDILQGIGLNHSQVSKLIPTTLGAHLVKKHKGFHCAKEDNLEYFYYYSDDNEDEDLSVADAATTTTTTAAAAASAAFKGALTTAPAGTSTVDHPNLQVDCKGCCMASENSSCSSSLYESAEDEGAWARPRSVSPLSVGSGMSPPPVASAPLVTCNREAQTEPPEPFWMSVGVATAAASSASVHVQTDQLDEGNALRMTLKKRKMEISELRETFQRQFDEHREEIQQLHSQIFELEMQLQKLTEDKQASPHLASVGPQTSSKEPEIHSLMEHKRETASPTINGDYKALDKTEFTGFYEVQMKMEQSGGSGSDLESVWSGHGMSPKRSKQKTAWEDSIIRRLKREKPNFTEAHIREYLSKFREERNGLSGLTVKTIVAGILALMKNDALSTQGTCVPMRCTS